MGKDADPGWIDDLHQQQCGVLPIGVAVDWIGRAAVRWRIERGRWQRPYPGVVVTHSGPLTRTQILWSVVVKCGPGAVLGGLTAAALDGLAGFEDQRTHVVVPAPRHVRVHLPGAVIHRSWFLGPADVHPVRQPPRTRLARSLLDAAAWMRSDDRAREVLAAAVQQRLVRAEDLAAELARHRQLRRHGVVAATLGDIEGGAQALSELDFCHLTRRYRICEPDRQVVRLDPDGRRRWLDAYWDHARLVAEADGLWHMEPAAWWADMRRDNHLTATGYRVLRFPAFAIRDDPALVASQIKAALRLPAVS